MSFPKNVWDQLKNITTRELIAALEKDGFRPDEELKTERIYKHPDGRRCSIHYHKGSKCYGPKLLKGLFKGIGWSEKDLRRIKLIK